MASERFIAAPTPPYRHQKRYFPLRRKPPPIAFASPGPRKNSRRDDDADPDNTAEDDLFFV